MTEIIDNREGDNMSDDVEQKDERDFTQLAQTEEDIDTRIELINSASNASIPAGGLVPFAGDGSEEPPTGFLYCDGSLISRSIYSALFTSIGIAYGSGDGNTTFALPDARGRAPVGTNDAGLPNGADGARTTRNEGDEGGDETHTLITSEMPSHTHGVFVKDGNGSNVGGGGANALATVQTGSAGSDGAHANMQPFFVVNYLIKT